MTAPPDPTELASELRTVVGRLVRRLRDERRDVSLMQVTVLGRLDLGGPAGISELAAAEHVRPQSMAATVASLESEGWVARSPHPDDRRRQVITLTRAGRAVLTADRERREGWLADAIARDLSARERRVLADAAKLLARLAGEA
jgi:DNA-binding MarR family transcriptional regulator